jgi:Asp-tRNA(Asn)/Glu-tRNA(Gln) amidotransferase A subunit family amidase
MTDDADAIVANPWAPNYSAGGSSGGTVTAEDAWQWSGMYRHGPIATTVSDAALLLSVLASALSLKLERHCYSADFEFSADQVGGYGLPRLPEDPWELAGLVQEFAIGLGEATQARRGCVDDPVESF